ncbi:hypothetical protein SUDANB95_06841 [Actinosynnema sp. ALI-1.44]
MSALVVLAYWVPGLVIGLALRLRGWTLAAAAPVLTFGGIGLGTYALGRTGVPWNLLTVALWFLVLAVVVGVPTWLVARRRAKALDAAAEAEPGEAPVAPAKRPLRDDIVVLVGVVAGMAVGALTFLKGIKGLNTVNQDWDAPFHGNAIRWIAEHEASLPSALGQIANLPGKADYFYPNTYHALLAPLLDEVAAMPELLNLAALSMVLAWPLGVAAMALAWRVPPLAAATAAAVSTWFSAFPYDSLWRGPLWPYVAGVALVPATLALARKIFTERGLGGPIAVALAMAGLVGLHTSLAFVMAVYALLLLVALVVRLEPVDWKVARVPLLVTAVLAVLAALPLALPAFANAAGVTSAGWPEFASPSDAFGQVLLWSPTQGFPLWFLGGAALVGIVLMMLHKRLLWVVGAWVVLGGLYAACASINSKLVDTLTGPFYNDAWRFAALLPLAGALAVGELVWTVATRIGAKSEARLGARAAFVVPVAVGLVGVLALAVLTKGAYLGRNTQRLGWSNHDFSTVTPGERQAYQWLKEHADGKPVANDIGDGSVWMYALAGVKPVEWTFYGAGEDSTAGAISYHLKEIETNPRVQKAVKDLGVRYVIVGRGTVRPEMPRSPGLKDLDSFPLVRKVYSNPDAAVYELVEPGDQRP